MEGRISWFCWWSDIARPQPVESDGGIALNPGQKIGILGFFVCVGVCRPDVTFLVNAIGVAIALGEPPDTHPTVLTPFGSVPWEFSG